MLLRRLFAAGWVVVVGSCRPAADDPPVGSWTDPSPHTAGFATVNGVRLHYLDWGGSGPALILVPGYGDNAHVFDDLAPAFTDRFRVVAYTRRGHGRSEARPPYDMETLVEDLRQLMDSLGIAQAHLVGWSMGGNEITRLAGKHPDRVGRLVYFDAGYDWADPGFVSAIDAFPADLTPPTSALASLDAFRGWIVGLWFPAVPADRLEAHTRDYVVEQADGSVRPAMSDSTNQALLVTLITSRRDYGAVRVPALAIYSASFTDLNHPDLAQRTRNRSWEERYFTSFREASIARIRRELGTVEIVTVPGTHADFVFTSRAQVVQAMRRFLDAP
jgi:pimeloyl-ACP methyl ester carboxylesterase